MTSEAFVDRLAALAPSKEALLGGGYNDAQAEAYRGCFVASRLGTPRETPDDDPALGLHAGWDVSRIQIGVVSFLQQPRAIGDVLQVAIMEACPIVRRPRRGDQSGDYVTLDSQALSHVVGGAAANGSALLEGLLVMAECFAKCATEEIDPDDDSAAEPYKRRCVAALGGDGYEGFATSVFGF